MRSNRAMPMRVTDHARLRLREFRIDNDTVRGVLNAPEVDYEQGHLHTHVARKGLWKVVYAVDHGVLVVLTVKKNGQKTYGHHEAYPQ